jgi:hypothetical protein
MGISRLFREIPTCPVCDGPCTHEFERSPWRLPDRLPTIRDDGTIDATPPAPPEPKPNKRGRRPEQHAPKGPEEDRMIRPEEDR